MDGRAEVMSKTGQSQFGRTRSATECVVGFQDQNRQFFLGEANGGRQAVWPGADDHRIILNIFRHPETRSKHRLRNSQAASMRMGAIVYLLLLQRQQYGAHDSDRASWSRLPAKQARSESCAPPLSRRLFGLAENAGYGAFAPVYPRQSHAMIRRRGPGCDF